MTDSLLPPKLRQDIEVAIGEHEAHDIVHAADAVCAVIEAHCEPLRVNDLPIESAFRWLPSPRKDTTDGR